MTGKVRLGVLSLIVCNIIWGAAFPIYKWALEAVPPFTFIFLRFFFGALLILPFVYKDLYVEKKDILKLIHLSIVGITLTISFLFFGLQYSSSINAPIVISSTPIFLILFAVLFLHERPRTKVIIGTGVSLIGVLCIILQPLFDEGLDLSIIGNVLLLLSTLGSVSHTLLLKKMLEKYNPVAITFWSFIIGSLPLLPLIFWETTPATITSMFSFQGIVGILFGIIFASSLAHVLNAIGVKAVAASEVGIFSYVDPVATILVAIPLLGEVLTPTYVISSVLIFFGIFIAENRLHWHPLHKLKQ